MEMTMLTITKKAAMITLIDKVDFRRKNITAE